MEKLKTDAEAVQNILARHIGDQCQCGGLGAASYSIAQYIALSTHPHTGTEDRATAREDMVERVARAICTADERNGGAAWDYGMSGDEKWNQRRHEQYRESARAAIEAYQASEAQRLPHPHTGGREAVIEECAQVCEQFHVTGEISSDAMPLIDVAMKTSGSLAKAIRALSPPLQKTQKE